MGKRFTLPVFLHYRVQPETLFLGPADGKEYFLLSGQVLVVFRSYKIFSERAKMKEKV